MDVLKKINHQLFWPLSLLTTCVFCLFAHGRKEILAILFVYGASLVALLLLMQIMHGIISDPQALSTGKLNKGKMILYMLLHLVFLFGSIGIGVHFMGNRIILAVLNYVTQIFVLGIGLRKNLK